jgi:hypothetical protein
MERIVKSLSLTLILIMSLSIIGTAHAQTIPKPSVPEFKLSCQNNVYDVPPTTKPDQWTGNLTIVPGYHVDYREVMIKIHNVPNNQYIDHTVNRLLYYSVREKSHTSSIWSEAYNIIGASRF